MDSRCVNRVATGASVGGALGASIGASHLVDGMHAVMTGRLLHALFWLYLREGGVHGAL